MTSKTRRRTRISKSQFTETIDFQSIEVDSVYHGERLDKVLSFLFPDFSRTYFQEMIDLEMIQLNGKVAIKRLKVSSGDQIEVTFKASPPSSLIAQEIELDILYEDEHLIAINKPAGMVVHPAPGHPDHTFVNALLFHCKHMEVEEGSIRPGIVHRLDKETSGVLIAAKTRQMQAKLTELFAERRVEKEYIAITTGSPRSLLCTSNIARHSTKRQEMTTCTTRGKEAETQFEILKKGAHLSLIRAHPKTGRTHQIRVHLKELGSPVLGDSLYSRSSLSERYQAGRHMLHAKTLKLEHPITKVHMELTAPLPQDMEKIIATI